MAKSIYQNNLDILIKTLEQKKAEGDYTKPSLLLHACCGPCSSYVLEYLAELFDITVYYYNPNIYPETEYFRRKEELKDFYTKFPPVLKNKIQVVEAEYNPDDFFSSINIKENPELATEPEKGERCRRCYEFRLKKSFDYAKENKFNYFCTTLSISPFKDAEKINIIGQALEDKENGPAWLPSDFKKKGGFLRSLQLSEEYNLYRQQYCGCVYSFQNKL